MFRARGVVDISKPFAAEFYLPPPFYSATKGFSLPLGRGVCETKSKTGRSRPRKPFISWVCCAQRGIETMVSEGARPWGRGRSGDCDLYTPLRLEGYFQGLGVGCIKFGPPTQGLVDERLSFTCKGALRISFGAPLRVSMVEKASANYRAMSGPSGS